MSVFGKVGEAAAEYLSKGWLLAVDGRLEHGEWDSDGTKHHDYDGCLAPEERDGAPEQDRDRRSGQDYPNR